MQALQSSWMFWAIFAATFAALTAIFAKVGIEDVDSDFATFFRTLVVIVALGAILAFRGKLQSVGSLSPKTITFLVLSGLATGASWVCYFRALEMGNASQVAPIDKLSVALVAIFATIFLGEHLSLTGWLGIGLISVGALLVAAG